MNASVTKTRDDTAHEVGEEPALDITGLRYRYDGQQADTLDILQGIDLRINDGEFVAVMGPSGCGKSTLLNIVAGFDKPADGVVLCKGRPVTRPGFDRGVVFQRPALYPWMSVLDNVTFGPKARGVRGNVKERARAMLDEVGLRGYESHKGYELSGGMQSRVALARTLVNEPRLLLMDEPFAALDAQTRTEMQELVLQIREQHRSSVLFVTHDIEEGLLLADRVVVLGGKPSGIVESIEVDAPRPRSYEVVMSPHFVELRKRVRNLFQGPVDTEAATNAHQ